MKTEKFYTLLSAAQQSPAHYQLAKQEYNSSTYTDSERLSVAFRTLIDGMYSHRCAVMPDFGNLRTNEGKAKRDSWLAAHQSHLPIKDTEHSVLTTMQATVQKLLDVQLERVVLPAYTPNGSTCTAPQQAVMADKARSKIYFFTAVSDASAYAGLAVKYGLHYRAGLLLLQARKAGYNIGLADVMTVAVDKTAPYTVRTFSFEAVHEAALLAKVEQALELVAQIEQSGASDLPAVVHTEVSLEGVL